MSSSSICPNPRSHFGRRRILVAAALAVWIAPAALALNPDRLVNQYIRDRWTEDRGFPGGAVYGFAQTPDGYLWIGSERGLVRFDGLSFQLFDHANTPVLSDSPVLGLAVDAEGGLWVRMQSRDVVRYRRGEFEIDSLLTDVTTMTQGPQGEIYLIRSLDAMCYRNRSLRTIPHPADTRLVVSAAATSDGSLWAGTRDSGLFDWIHGHAIEVRGLPDLKVNHLLPGVGNELWAGTDRGLSKWNGATLTQEGLPAVLKSASILALARDRDSNLWLGTPNGLMRLTAAGAFAVEAPAGGPPEAANAIFEDREGDLWIGRMQGIERFRDSTFLTSSTRGSGIAEAGGPIYVDRAGRTWEGPASGGLFALQDGRWRSVTAAGLANDVVYSIDGSAGGIWVGRQHGGLTRLELPGGTPAGTFTADDGLAKGSIYAVRRSRDGAVWAGSLGGGVSRVRNGRVTTYTTANGLPSNTISAIEEDAEGTMWFATPNGLSSFSQNRWRALSGREGLPPGRINCLSAGSGGVLWIGTDVGLAFLRGGQARIPRDQPGALVDQILGVADDGRDGVWVMTPKFVARLSRAHLLGEAPGPGPMRIFGLADGIPVPEGVRRDRPVVSDEAGRIWFSLRRGVSMVDPSRLSAGSAAPLLRVESVTADGAPLDPSAALSIPVRRQRLRFAYFAVSLSIPELIRYRYRLDNFDRDWSEPLPSREAVYTNLAPGHYRFRVVAGTGEGGWNGAETSVGFDVVPEVWQMFWFRLLVLAATAVLAAGIYWLHVRRVTRLLAIRYEERLAERTRIGQELHDTLLQGLLAASMQIQLAVDAVPEDSPARGRFDRALTMLGLVVDEGRQAVRGLRSPGLGANELESAFSRVREEFSGAPEFRMVVDGKSRPLNPLIRDEVYRIGREALVNAFRHSGSRAVEMQIEYNGHLRVAVRDGGRGIDEEALHAQALQAQWQGRGLIGMREGAEAMGAEFRVWSRARAGTELVLTVPGHVAFPPDDSPSNHWASRI